MKSVFDTYKDLRFWRRIKYIPKIIKSAWQRCIRGYSDVDIWNLDKYLLYLIPNSLRTLARNSHSYDASFSNIEEWRQHLYNIACHFDNVSRESDISYFPETYNQYTKEYIDQLSLSKDEKDETIMNKYYDREKEIDSFRQAELHKGFELLEKIFFSCWD